jgi:maltooligosyltrehalose trehalohydrolase
MPWVTPEQGRRCGAIPGKDGCIRWRVWAPKAKRVDLVLLDGEGRRTHPMTPEGRGYFACGLDGLPEALSYAYLLDGERERPDPASLWQPDGVGGPSRVYQPARFAWTDTAWPGVRREALVVYELHVGTFTPEGTFKAVIPRLPELRALGVTAVELMPVGQFPGGRNWGYDGVFLYAAQNTYGGPAGLQKLVDACHAAGVAVLLDVVYNHLGPEGNYLSEFGPYFTDKYRTPWGSAVNYDEAGCDAVREFVTDNARMWVEDFHLDGLRLDAVHAIHDEGPWHLLQEVQEAVGEVSRRTGRPLHVIAESDLNDPRLLRPVGRGGYGLSGQWADDFHHAVHAHLTGERHGYYADFGRPDDLARVLESPFLYAGEYSEYRGRRHGAPAGDLPGDRFVVCIQNHDQVGNRAAGDRLNALVGPAAGRLAASLLLLSPYVPMLFMGEEYGEKAPFPFFCSFADPQLVEAVRRGRRAEFAAFAWQGEVPDPQAESTFASAKLSWSWPEGSPQAHLRRLYQDLLTARREWPALGDFGRPTARMLPADGVGVLELFRGGRGGGLLQAFFNLTDRPQPAVAGREGTRVLFCSESARYGGAREGDPAGRELLPFECVAYGPAGWKAFD